MKRIVIVTGPPFGGKSTYVKEHMGPNDVVYDFDEMKAAVCLCNPHAEKNHARELLWDLRHAFMEHVIEDQTEEIETVFFIQCRVTSQWMNRLHRATRAYIQVVKCEATLEECLERLEKDQFRPDKDRQREIIEAYFVLERNN